MMFHDSVNTFDVACPGIMVADVVARPVTGLPARGQLALVDKMELHTGGCAVNTGIALAKLGRRVAELGDALDDLADFFPGCGMEVVALLSAAGRQDGGARVLC
ncbi:MAG: hypothetical protein U9Q78_07260 [Chloroflexota bacterium]|nr:hypothetical protein [Chloroflexota bacterium]